MTAVDDGMLNCKLALNGAKRVRHYWQSKNNVCDCGCKTRIYINGKPICLTALIEILNDAGYSVSKNYKVDSNDKN